MYFLMCEDPILGNSILVLASQALLYMLPFSHGFYRFGDFVGGKLTVYLLNIKVCSTIDMHQYLVVDGILLKHIFLFLVIAIELHCAGGE